MSFVREHGPKLKEGYLMVKHLKQLTGSDSSIKCFSCHWCSCCMYNWKKVCLLNSNDALIKFNFFNVELVPLLLIALAEGYLYSSREILPML